MTLQHSPACERNREPILKVLRAHLHDATRVLEIGSGTGQHAVYFAENLPHLVWQPSDQPAHLEGIAERVRLAALPNLRMPVALWAQAEGEACGLASTDSAMLRTLTEAGAGASGFDAVFTANTLHIMGWPEVEALFDGLHQVLREGRASLVAYGPFNRDGRFTSDSNRDFDGWLKARDPASGIRDAEAVDALARGIGFALREDVAMPANNRCLVWQRG